MSNEETAFLDFLYDFFTDGGQKPMEDDVFEQTLYSLTKEEWMKLTAIFERKRSGADTATKKPSTSSAVMGVSSAGASPFVTGLNEVLQKGGTVNKAAGTKRVWKVKKVKHMHLGGVTNIYDWNMYQPASRIKPIYTIPSSSNLNPKYFKRPYETYEEWQRRQRLWGQTSIKPIEPTGQLKPLKQIEPDLGKLTPKVDAQAIFDKWYRAKTQPSGGGGGMKFGKGGGTASAIAGVAGSVFDALGTVGAQKYVTPVNWTA
jgi:hypothetical protein